MTFIKINRALLAYNVIIMSVIFLSILGCKGEEERARSLTDKSLSSEEIKQIAKETYIALFPIVYNYGTMYSQAINNDAPEYIGGFRGL